METSASRRRALLMDSTVEEARSHKRARLTAPYAAAGDDTDRISGLGDDVLLHILGLVGDASDAARTGALSRRWRGLWARAPALRFASRPVPRDASGRKHRAALKRFVSAVNGVLARRALSGDCAVERLAILYATDSASNREQLMAVLANAAQGWIRYAFRHAVKCLDVHLRPPLEPHDDGDGDVECRIYFGHDYEHVDYDEGDDGKPMVIIDDELLPSPEKLETMRLALGNARLRLPAAMKFTSLVELSLERIEIAAAAGAHLLVRLVSSATCPCLRKLRMRKLFLPLSLKEETMQIDAALLSELWMEEVHARSLELRTPSLRVLHIDRCCDKMLRISASKLERLTFFPLGNLPWRLEVDGGLPHLRSLKLFLTTLRPSYESVSDTNILLLKQCTSVTCLEVILKGEPECGDEEVMETKVPHLPQVTSLTVSVSDMFERHDFGAAVASLLTRFKNLRRLNLHLPFFHTLYYNLGAGLDMKCRHQDHWTSQQISMAHLQEVELTGLTGTDCELWFMKIVLASAKSLYKVAIRFNPECWQHQGKMDAFEKMLLDEGMSTSHRDTFTLNTCMNLHCTM